MIGEKGFEAGLTEDLFRKYLMTVIDILSWRAVFALALMVFVSLTEGIALLLLFPLMSLVGLDVGEGVTGRLAEFVLSVFRTAGISPTLIAVLLFFVLINALQALLGRWQTTLNLALEQDVVAELRQRLYRSIANANWLFFSRNRASDFTHALTTEIDRVGVAVYYSLSLIATAVVTLVYVLLALRLSPPITGLVFACGAMLLFSLKPRMQVARASGEELSAATNELYAAAIEHISGMKTVKSYGAGQRNVALFSKLTERVSRVYVSAVRNQAGVSALFRIGSVVILALILYVSLEVLRLPIAAMFLLLFLFSRIMPQFSTLQQNYQQLAHDLPAFATVIELQTRCEAAADPQATRIERVELLSEIRCSRVSFTYDQGEADQGEAQVISDLDLVIRRGETTAIVGPSGVGKSTIADLVMGLIGPDRGQVLVDDAPLTAERMRSWRDQIGYVAQDTFLFHDTIRANLLWASPSASEEEMRQALRLAAAEEFVMALPGGLDTVVGDRGVRLSGGERQRIALARALLRRPLLLILDEATSALDSENERRIQRAIEELHGNMTILIITHRLSTIREADVIYLLERGAVAERGSWDQLLAKKDSQFSLLYRAQRIESKMESQEALEVG